MEKYSTSNIEFLKQISNGEDQLKFWLGAPHLPYYPEFHIDTREMNQITLRTIVRKEHNGEWYWWIVKETGYKMLIEDVICNLMRTCYQCMILGVMPENIAHRENIFPKDKLQTSEEQRLKTIYP